MCPLDEFDSLVSCIVITTKDIGTEPLVSKEKPNEQLDCTTNAIYLARAPRQRRYWQIPN